MVHTTNLPDIAKFTHLHNELGAEPLRAIQGIYMAPGAYEGAWQTLLQRYDDKQVIVNAHLGHSAISLMYPMRSFAHWLLFKSQLNIGMYYSFM